MTKRRFKELQHEYLTTFAAVVNAHLFPDKIGQRKTKQELRKYEAFIRVVYGGRVLHYLRKSILRIVKRRMLLANSLWLTAWIQLVDNSVDSVDNIKGQRKSGSTI